MSAWLRQSKRVAPRGAGFQPAPVRARCPRSKAKLPSRPLINAPCLLVAFFLLSGLAMPAGAADGAGGKERTRDNSERKVASAIGIKLPPRSAPVHGATRAVHKLKQGARSSPQLDLSGLAAKLPPQVEEVVDTGSVVAGRLFKVARARFDQIAHWLAKLAQELNASVPGATPAADPYVARSMNGARLYLTGEGRLKTVVSR